MPRCSCGKGFSDYGPLYQHQNDTGHSDSYCRQCSRYFNSPSGLEQHSLAVHQWFCEHCDRNYNTQERLENHQRSTGHCYCRDCDRFFVDPDALTQHLRSSSLHIEEFRCCDCDRDFASERALEQHLTDKDHSVFERQFPDNYCPECDRWFVNEQAFQQHQQNSTVHHPLSQIECFARDCKKIFTRPSAFLHHLESGSCSSGVNRQKLNFLIQEHDQDRLISNVGNDMVTELTQRLENIAGGSGRNTPGANTDEEDSSTESGWATPSTNSNREVILTPNSSSSRSVTVCRRQSMDLSDVRFLSENRCVLCPPTNPLFCNSQALQQHLASAAHAPRIFSCPVSLFPAARQQEGFLVKRTFSTLSGLAQHLESGACDGGEATFRKTARYVEAKLKELGWNAKLLSDNPQK